MGMDWLFNVTRDIRFCDGGRGEVSKGKFVYIYQEGVLERGSGTGRDGI